MEVLSALAHQGPPLVCSAESANVVARTLRIPLNPAARRSRAAKRRRGDDGSGRSATDGDSRSVWESARRKR